MAPTLQCGRCPIVARSAFACLTPEQRDWVERTAIPHRYSRGEAIFYEGNPPLAVYCIRSGQAKITRRARHEEAVVALHTTGDLIGYRAVLAELPYGISATAMEPSVVCTIERESFLSLVEQSHPLARDLLKRMALEYRLAEAQLVERNGERVAKRTARLLVRLARSAAGSVRTGEPIPIGGRRADLAHLLGTTPETLSRTLRGFAGRGLLGLSRTEIYVRDLPSLEGLAE